MPKKKPKVPSYRLHKPSGQAVVTLSGRDHYLGKHGTDASRRQYDAVLAIWMAHGRRLPSERDEPATMADLLIGYWEYGQTYYRRFDGSPSRELENFRAVIRLLRDLHRDLPVTDFSPRHLKAVRQVMIDRGWARKSINRQVVRIRTIFKWGVSEDLVPPEVHAALKAVDGLRAGRSDAKERPPVRPVTESEVDRTLKHLPQVVADMVELQWLTGMRPGELCSLRPVDLDTAGPVWLYRPAEHKTAHHGRERVIPIGPKGQAILGWYLDRPIDQPCFSPAEAQEQRREARRMRRQTPMCCGNRAGTNRKKRPSRAPGVRYTTTSYARAIRHACRAAGMERWSPNQLRHACATRIRREAGLEMARAVLGHSTASITEQFYAEVDLGKAADLMLKLG